MNLNDYTLPCLFKTLFGIECLGCGFQRAVILMLKGELIQAFCMYPAVYLVILFCGMLFVQTVFKHKYHFKFVAITALTTWIFVLGGYIFKNL